MRELLSDLVNLISNLLFPKYCLLCEIGGTYLCANCSNKLEPINAQYCIVCNKLSLGGLTHPVCQTKFTPSKLICIYNYKDEQIKKLISHGKYKFIPEIFENLSLAATPLLPEYLSSQKIDLIIPMPLHKKRNNWRGYNQSQIIAQAISKDLNIPISEALIKIKNTTPQKDLSREERIKNIIGAFNVVDLKLVKDMRILLIDDVSTTGSSLKEASKTLLKSGSLEVLCLALAKD
jgi:ComF family protein